jgi:uncharacterized alpha-E superfamily protein
VERADNLARLLAVAEGFATSDDDKAAWRGVLDTFADGQAFAETGKKLSGLNVARWYFIDRKNPNSIASALASARENARALRHITPTETWKQINMLNALVSRLTPRQVTLPKLADLCEQVRLGCQAHQGGVDGSWYRDEAWIFHRMGCELERADQTTRLVDVKYYQITKPGEDGEMDVTPPDSAWWNSLLRSASSYHAFRRRHALSAGPAEAATFLLFDEDCPRSVRLSVNAAAYRLEELEIDYDAAPDDALRTASDQLVALLSQASSIKPGKALHRYLDEVQIQLSGFANGVAARYFGPD